MPLLRLTKTDFANPTDSFADMTLAFTTYDELAYNFDWTGRNGLLPVAAVARAVNPNTRRAMMRSVWIACDSSSSGFWGAGDSVTVHSSRFGVRGVAVQLSQTIIKLPVMSPSDRIYLAIGAKPQAYAIEIMINSVDEGDFGFPELPVS